MRKKWRVTAEVDMDASQNITLEVCTNLKHKAIKLATEELEKAGVFLCQSRFLQIMR